MKANKAFFIFLEKWLEGQFGEKWDTTVVEIQKMSHFHRLMKIQYDSVHKVNKAKIKAKSKASIFKHFFWLIFTPKKFENLHLISICKRSDPVCETH